MSELCRHRDAYLDGLFARAIGQSVNRNPFPEHSEDAARWVHGWWMIDESLHPASDKSDWAQVAVNFGFGATTVAGGGKTGADSASQNLYRHAFESARTLLQGLALAAVAFVICFLVLRLLGA